MAWRKRVWGGGEQAHAVDSPGSAPIQSAPQAGSLCRRNLLISVLHWTKTSLLPPVPKGHQTPTGVPSQTQSNRFNSACPSPLQPQGLLSEGNRVGLQPSQQPRVGQSGVYLKPPREEGCIWVIGLDPCSLQQESPK